MPTRCSCGSTRCLECVGECPDCGDMIENYNTDNKEGLIYLTKQ